MMKKLLLFLSILLLILTGCVSDNSNEEASQKITFYYAVEGTEQLTSDLSIDSEERNIQIFTLKQLLELYLQGPISENLTSPFPAGTEVVALSEGENGPELTLSGAFFTLQGVDLSIASCCLVRTVCDYINVEQITVLDEMARISMQLRPDDFLLEDHFNQDSNSTFTLYFSDENRRYLIAETREVTLSENESPEVYVLRQLMLGPTGDELLSVIPQGTELLGVETTDGVCTVNLSKEFLDNRSEDDYANYAAVGSIVNTLTSLEEVSSVLFLVEGQPVSEYGIFSLEKDIRRNAGSIGPVRANGTEMDVNVYVLSEDGTEQFAVPVRVKLSISQPLAEAVAEAAIGYEGSYGFYNPIPYGTQLLGVSVSGSTCYLDLSREFIPSDGTEAAEKAAVWALVTALTELDNISSVVLTIDNEGSGLNYVDISEPLTKNSVSID